MEIDTDKLIDRFETYSKIFTKYFPDEGAEKFLEDFGSRLVTCPRGLTDADGGRHGSLLEFLTQVALKAKQTSEDVCDTSSCVRIALSHELGKLGDIEAPLYVEQESSWHREKLGQNFKYNDKCPKMTVPHRTLHLFQKYGIKLSRAEWVAIMTSQGVYAQDASFYAKEKSLISSVLDFARSLSK